MNPRNLPRAAALAMLLIFAAAAGLLSCSDSESRVPFGQMATVVINLNLPAEHPTAMNDSIWNSIRRFFATDAVAQTAPATFSQINVRVTGPDMGAVEQQFSPFAQISMSVPAGSFRQVEVTAYVAPGDPSAALSFRGTAITNLPAGETVSVPVVMTLHETKIVLADQFFDQIVKIDSIASGDMSWQINKLGYTTDFNPTEIDFDSRGRIYIARISATDAAPVIRINNINSPAPDDIIVSLAGVGVKAISINRKNHILYYVTSANALYSCSCNGGAATGPYPNTGSGQTINIITGIAYDTHENVLYISGSNIGGGYGIFKYSLESTSINDYYIDPAIILSIPNHVLAKYPYVYVANTNGNDNYRVLQLTKDMELVKGYGINAAVENTNPGMFYGPTRFIAVLNRKITMIDEDDDNFGYRDKLISMNDINGTGWDTYGQFSFTPGRGYFQFYWGT